MKHISGEVRRQASGDVVGDEGGWASSEADIAIDEDVCGAFGDELSSGNANMSARRLKPSVKRKMWGFPQAVRGRVPNESTLATRQGASVRSWGARAT